MASVEDLVVQLEALLPHCHEEGATTGPCLQEAKSGRGFTIFTPDEKVCLSDVLLPGFNLLPRWFLGLVYLLFLLYLFCGIALASDLFMDGIMEITSTKRKVKRKDANGNIYIVEEPVWNWVVANITLMSVGSSAPEISLAIVESILTLDKPAGELGPATIVGSGAYNMLVITAVCILALKDGEFKKISQLRVYVTTALWSLWAHIWLLVVYSWWTPDEITMTEAFLTLGMFGLVVLNAWVIDIQPWKKNKVAAFDPADPESGGHASELPQGEKNRSMAFYRHILAARTNQQTKRQLSIGAPDLSTQTQVIVDPSKQQVLFRSSAYSFVESAGKAIVTVIRSGGDLDVPVTVYYKTEDGDAVAGLDYEAAEGILYFGKGEDSKSISINIVDDDVSEPDVAFFVTLVKVESKHEVIISQRRVQVTIVDDDDAGVVGFEVPEYEVGYNASVKYAEVYVVRRSGYAGRIQVDYSTHNATAEAGRDFVEGTGTVQFETGETKRKVKIELMGNIVSGPRKVFTVVLSDPKGGAKLSNRTSCTVNVVSRAMTLEDKFSKQNSRSLSGKVEEAEGFNLKEAWYGNFVAAFSPAEPDEGGDVGKIDLFMHYVNFTWKVMMSAVPPAEWKGGYPCFFTAILFIVGQVYLVHKIGTLFGCIAGLKDIITGISLIALGTSLPDTLASRIAAINEPDADAAIGNITGSNSVNVFLGLGIPWVINSVYYYAKGKKYETPAGDLAFSVIIFCCVAGAAIVLLAVRRLQGGELGGSKRVQWILTSILFMLWGLYLVLSSLKAYHHI